MGKKSKKKTNYIFELPCVWKGLYASSGKSKKKALSKLMCGKGAFIDWLDGGYRAEKVEAFKNSISLNMKATGRKASK